MNSLITTSTLKTFGITFLSNIDNFYAFLSSNQAILEKGYYKLGKKLGIWNFYTENGTLIKKLDYKSGLGIPENISP